MGVTDGFNQPLLQKLGIELKWRHCSFELKRRKQDGIKESCQASCVLQEWVLNPFGCENAVCFKEREDSHIDSENVLTDIFSKDQEKAIIASVSESGQCHRKETEWLASLSQWLIETKTWSTILTHSAQAQHLRAKLVWPQWAWVGGKEMRDKEASKVLGLNLRFTIFFLLFLPLDRECMYLAHHCR